jgi:Zn ribbon nucleic-acid-binding protein
MTAPCPSHKCPWCGARATHSQYDEVGCNVRELVYYDCGLEIEWRSNRQAKIMVGCPDKHVLEEIRRSCADVECWTCGMTMREHPWDMDELDWQGNPFLHIVCDGTRVKL